MPWNHDFVTSNLFLYLLNVFMQYHRNKYYCKLKALFSHQRSPPQSVLLDPLMCDDSKCFQCMPAFTIWYSASNDNGKCYKNTGDKRHFLERLVRFILYLYSLNTRFENTAFHFGLLFFTLWPLTLVRISVSHAYGCQSVCSGYTAQEQSWISWWTAWTKRCDDLQYECSAPSISDLFIPAFHISGFAHWSCTFVNLVLTRCRCIKACFWFYQNWCKISHEKHSHKGPIISVLYFSNVKKISRHRIY